MSENLLVMVAGMVLSLGFGYVPGLSDWYERQDSKRKALVMLAALLLAVVVILVGSCYLRYAWITCDEAGWKLLASMFLYALLANQGTYQIAKHFAPAR
jgi:uncharacterized membrane protein